MPTVKHVAIIGGGIGGLAAAYYLQNLTSRTGDTFHCTVFEKRPFLGGNVLTAYFDQQYQKPFADMGVNDFNINAYHRMKEILDRLAAEGLEVPCPPLVDNTCYFTLKGDPRNVSYTEKEMEHWEQHTDKPYLKTFNKNWQTFQGYVSTVLNNPGKFLEMSVGSFLRDYGFDKNFCVQNVLARINGMYFMNGTRPEDMPITAVMHYYQLQEGLGTPDARPADRRYFGRGASQWVNQLETSLRRRGVDFILGVEPKVYASDAENPRVQVGSASQTFDHVVSAVYANQVPQVIVSGLDPRVQTELKAFQYLPSRGTAHWFGGVLPPDPKQRQSYNILIHPEEMKVRPYTISYVENMHQGDLSPTDPYYVTYDEVVPIPDSYVLEMIDPFNPGGRRLAARVEMWHNTLTSATFTAQANLEKMQGHRKIYFTGGWTLGAGLHEEILASAQQVARRIRGFFLADESHHYDPDRPDYVPQYIRDALDPGPVQASPLGFWS